MARIEYTVEIAGVTDAEANDFFSKLKAMPKVVDVEKNQVDLDGLVFPPLEVSPKSILDEGYVICYWDDKRHPHSLMWNKGTQKSYDYYFNCCLGKLDPVLLSSAQLSDFANLCYS